jgi:imidazoleglycerol-phosphate dehydratase/histidinol-phosphatase
MLQVFESQGIAFDDIFIDTSQPTDHSPARKPGIAMVMHLLRRDDVDWRRSAMVGDRETDVAFAANLGIPAFQLRTPQFGGEWDWPGIAHALCDAPRMAGVSRQTTETRIEVDLDLDRSVAPQVSTGLGFLDHMLQQLGAHAGVGLRLRASGDLQVDEHHTVEDCALALGEALRQALGGKHGIARYGFSLPMDESLATAVLDLSGRPHFSFRGGFARERVGDLPTELVPHFFRSFADAARLTLHLSVDGDNDHHKIEACFKALARALDSATRIDPRRKGDVPSTKGVI